MNEKDKVTRDYKKKIATLKKHNKLYFIKDSTKTTLLPGNNALDAFSFEGRINLVRLMTFKKATFLLNLFKGR